MVLVFEEKEKAVKLMVNPLKPVEKAIQVSYKNFFRMRMCVTCFSHKQLPYYHYASNRITLISGDGKASEEGSSEPVILP